MKSRLLCVVIAVVMCLTLSAQTVAFAESSNAQTQDEAIDKVEKMFTDAGFHIDEESINRKGQAEIDMSAGGIQSTVTVEKATEEEVVLDIKEGDKEDKLVFTDTGEIFLDGNKVTVEVIKEDAKGAVHPDGPQRITNTLSCPYGTSSDYNRKVGTEVHNVYLGKSIVSVTLSVLTGIITRNWKYAVGAGVALSIAEQIYKLSKIGNIKSNAASIKVNKYIHKKGYLVKPGMQVTEMNTSYYFDKNATGALLGKIKSYQTVRWL